LTGKNFDWKIWRENLAGKFGGNFFDGKILAKIFLAGKFWRENFGGKNLAGKVDWI
jgi:hypothetical protein